MSISSGYIIREIIPLSESDCFYIADRHKNEAPWPGYLVGGGHTATDWVDEEEDYARNEIAINWQAPLVFALAWMMN